VVTAAVVGRAHALPGQMGQESLWTDFFEAHYGGSRLAGAVWRRSGVRTRHGVADPRVEDVSGWSTGERMRRFLVEALPLGKEALTGAMDDAGLAPGDVGQLTVVSCTGYATPGLDVLLARDLGLSADCQRLSIGHMGCYAAIPGLATASDVAVARGKTTLLLCLELTSLHVQPPSDDSQQMVAHALFGDAAAAVAVAPRTAHDRPGLEVLDVASRTDGDSAALMTWDVTDLGFRMGLSPQVPRVLREHVEEVVDGLLARSGLVRGDVEGWAVHPGGPRIVDVVAQRLGLDDEQVAASREVLRDHGNCSSATLLLILDRLLTESRLGAGGHVVALAFGPGLTLYATLLRRTG